MKQCLRLGAFAILALTGCARHYAITLTNSDTLIAKTKPRLERGYYVFKDTAGKEVRINELKVRQIEPR